MPEQVISAVMGLGLLDAMLAQPEPVRLWVGWLVFVNLLVPLLFIDKAEAWASMIAFAVSAVIMTILYEQFGYARILGLAHLLVWPFLLYWLSQRWWGIELPLMRLWIAVLFVSNSISLAIDAIDVARFFLKV